MSHNIVFGKKSVGEWSRINPREIKKDRKGGIKRSFFITYFPPVPVPSVPSVPVPSEGTSGVRGSRSMMHPFPN